MASIYDSNIFLGMSSVAGYTPIPKNYSPTGITSQSLYRPQQSTFTPGSFTAPKTLAETKTTDLTQGMAEIQESINKHLGKIGEQTAAATEYYNKANMANKIAGYTSIAQGAFNLIDTYNARSSVRLTNKQLDMQKDLIDLNIKNSEAILSAQFKNAIADLQTVYAAKNVDVSSQAVRSQIVGSGEEMGKDMADTRTQGKLQKLAIDFQKTMNNINQRRSEQQAWINFGANIASNAMFLI